MFLSSDLLVEKVQCSTLNLFTVTGPTSSRRRRGVELGSNDLNLGLVVQKCFFTNCIPPPDPETTPPPTSRPTPFSYWNDDIWTLNTATNVYEARLDGTGGPPPTGSDVLITSGTYSHYNLSLTVNCACAVKGVNAYKCIYVRPCFRENIAIYTLSQKTGARRCLFLKPLCYLRTYFLTY